MRSAAMVTGTLALTGAGAVVALGALAVALHEPTVAAPGALATAFLAAGLVGGRARPDHRGVQLLLAVGALHLLAFAVSGWVGTRPYGTTAWWLALLALASFAAGFAALALLLAGYPSARMRSRGLRRFAVLCVAVPAVVVVGAVLSPGVPLVLGEDAGAVPAPAGLLTWRLPLDLQQSLPLLVVCGASVLVVRSRRASAEVRRQLEWATLAGAVLAILLLATPAASAVLPSTVWTVFFAASMSLVPFALLGGLVRHRLLDVDVMVVRTIGRGALFLAVLGCYAGAALLLGAAGRSGGVAAVALTLLAVVSGGPLLRRAESLADRWFTGGRVHRGALMDELATTLVAAGPDQLPAKVCATLRTGLDVSWVRLVLGDTVLAVAGTPPTDQAPAVSAALVAGSDQLGLLACGPRRGGWGRSETARLDRLAPHVALALRDLELSRELAERVEELTSSRARLVRAEETVRRQVERDLHDGVQQQLVALLARLSVAAAQLASESPAVATLAAAQDLARDALADLRRLVSGIHPALLGDRGLVAAVEARASLLPIVVVVDTDPRIVDLRFAPEVEGAAFFVVSESLANVMKHSGSDRARVVVAPLDEGGLRVAVTDEGTGTASYDGTGLAGLRDRVEALGGRFVVQATPDVGTTVLAEFTAAPTLVSSDV